MSDPQLKEVTDPADPDLAALARLLIDTFADPNIVLGLDRMQEFLTDNRPDGPRSFGVLVVIDADQHDSVVGGCVFSHVARSNCGFSEYMVADRGLRGRGMGRRLFEARRLILDTEARRLGYPACRGVFIEVENPDRTPVNFAAAERETALEGWERLRIFDHMGFKRVDVPYVQPPLAEGKVPIDYLDLLFASWQPDTLASERIPATWVFDTVEAIWSAWTPSTAAAHLDTLKRRVRSSDVALQPALDSQPVQGA
jgi:GNAT superfamily N-acetyltransferase